MCHPKDRHLLSIPDTVSIDREAGALVLIDQTKLPGETVLLSLTGAEEIHEAIRSLRVRGAPAIGVAAAIGLWAVVHASPETDPVRLENFALETSRYLATARPTAVNLFWALRRMDDCCKRMHGQSAEALRQALLDEALAIRDEDIATCRALGEYGLTLLRDGDGVLTHCNAGQLAAVRYGTALAPLHLGASRGMHFHVFTDETRPLLQGIRLSAYELAADGIETTVICDNMASQVMKNGWVQSVFVGADRIAANGDTVNKIGTSGVAILAQYYHIPFYVVAPTSTFDLTMDSGREIPIEQRSADEIGSLWYSQSLLPPGVQTFNPAFDCTDHSLITAIVTEKGILRPPFSSSIAQTIGIQKG